MKSARRAGCSIAAASPGAKRTGWRRLPVGFHVTVVTARWATLCAHNPFPFARCLHGATNVGLEVTCSALLWNITRGENTLLFAQLVWPWIFSAKKISLSKLKVFCFFHCCSFLPFSSSINRNGFFFFLTLDSYFVKRQKKLQRGKCIWQNLHVLKKKSSNLEGHFQENMRKYKISSIWKGIAIFDWQVAERKLFFLFKHSPNLQLTNFLVISGVWSLFPFAFHLQICFFFFSFLLSCLPPLLSHVGSQLFKSDLTARVSVLASKYPSIIRVFQRTEAAVYELFMCLSLKYLVVATQAPGLMRAGITHVSRSNISEELWPSRQKPHSLQKERRMPPVKLSGRGEKSCFFSLLIDFLKLCPSKKIK